MHLIYKTCIKHLDLVLRRLIVQYIEYMFICNRGVELNDFPVSCLGKTEAR